MKNQDLTTPYGNVPAGWKRWERARRNAVARPDSPSAKLYTNRITLAMKVGEELKGYPGPFVFEKATVNWSTVEYHRTSDWKPEYYVCSSYCAALQLQLELDNRGDRQLLKEELINLMLSGDSARPGRRVMSVRPQRVIHCRACNALIDERVGAVPMPSLPSVRKHTVIIDGFGNIVETEHLRLVEVTDGELELLAHYVEPAARQEYGAAHGRPVTLQ